MNEHRVFPLEEAAEICTVSGWRCKTCNQFYGNGPYSEQAARKCCCKDFACECGNRIEGQSGYYVCDPCRSKAKRERYLTLEKKPWDGDLPLYSDRYDKWFVGSDIEEQIYEYLQEPPPGWKYGDPEVIREISEDTLLDLQLLICEEQVKSRFDAQDYWHDDLAEDQEIDDADEINEIVNKWAQENVPVSYNPTNYAVDLSSLKIEGMQ